MLSCDICRTCWNNVSENKAWECLVLRHVWYLYISMQSCNISHISVFICSVATSAISLYSYAVLQHQPYLCIHMQCCNMYHTLHQRYATLESCDMCHTSCCNIYNTSCCDMSATPTLAYRHATLTTPLVATSIIPGVATCVIPLVLQHVWNL